jgi:mRNA interferase RelE/StbE
LAWTIEYADGVEKTLRKLGRQASAHILAGLEEVAALDSPRQRGEAMVGNHAGHWRYRFGDYRVIARIEDGRMVILVIAVGHRREIYR